MYTSEETRIETKAQKKGGKMKNGRERQWIEGSSSSPNPQPIYSFCEVLRKGNRDREMAMGVSATGFLHNVQ
jgi:hypothetical protein